jgi:Fuc2NAc and GlcNAc transferase
MILPGLLSFLVSFALTPALRSLSHRLGLFDIPNARSSHDRPTPRIGGAAIVLSTAIGLAVFASLSHAELIVALSAASVALLGLLDDLYSLSARLRFVCQMGAACVVVFVADLPLNRLALSEALMIPLGALAIPAAIFWVVGYTNAFNFMDGINGIAAFQAIVGGATFAVIFASRNDYGWAALALAAACAAAGFLPWNFPRAVIFMGDVGSGALGFSLSTFVLHAVQGGTPFVLAIPPLLPFLCDTSVTLIRRVMRGERFFEAHRGHYYQRLNQQGWSHHAVTLLWTLLSLMGAMVAILGVGWNGSIRFAAVVALLAVHAAIFVLIDRGRLVRASTLTKH